MKCRWVSTAVVLALSGAAGFRLRPDSAAGADGGWADDFDTVPGWGLGPDGKSVLGALHGGVESMSQAASTPAPTRVSSCSHLTAR